MNRLLVIGLSLVLAACNTTTDNPDPGDPDAGIDPLPTALVKCVDNGFTSLWDVNNLHGAIGTAVRAAARAPAPWGKTTPRPGPWPTCLAASATHR